MNKKLVALAVTSALAAPLAAQAQTANVTLYGRVHATFEVAKGDFSNDDKWYTRVSANSSRIGVRGEEMLGGGTKAIFQIESSVATDGGGGTLGGRDTFVGLQGGWGTFKIGNFLAPYDDIHPIFGNGVALLTSSLSAANIWANATNGKGQGGFDARLGNSVRYDSPTFGGLSFAVQYAMPSAVQESPLRGNTISLSGLWNFGIGRVGIGYERDSDLRCTSTSGVLNCDSTDWAASIAGRVNFGPWYVTGVYERLEYDGGSASSIDRNFWGVGGGANFGAWDFYAFYGNAGDYGGSGSVRNFTGTPPNTGNASTIVAGGDTGAYQWQITAGYKISKRTGTYIGYHQIKNDDNAGYTFNINAVPVTKGNDPQIVVMGLYHLF
jgi:predicted porin